MYCPYCLKKGKKISGEKTSERAIYTEDWAVILKKGKIVKTGEWNHANIKHGVSPLRNDKRLKEDFNKTLNQQWRFYKCPRCKGFFKTVETITYYSYAHVPKRKDTDKYDATQKRKKVNKIIKKHLIEKEYPPPKEKHKEIPWVREEIVEETPGEIKVRVVSKQDIVREMVSNVFGEYIDKDYEHDLLELYHKKLITKKQLDTYLKEMKDAEEY